MNIVSKNRRNHLKWLGILPLAAVLLIFIFLMRAPSVPILPLNYFPSQYLTIFLLGGGCFLGAYLAWRGFTLTGQVQLMLFAGGAVALGMAFATSSIVFILSGLINVTTAIYTLGILLSSILFLAAAVFGLRGGELIKSKSIIRWLTLSVNVIILLLPFFFWILDMTGALPTFFIWGQGETQLRAVILNVAILLFIMSGLAYLCLNRRNASNFIHWYGLGLLFLALGFFVNKYAKLNDDSFLWLGRLSQYLGVTYFILAVVSALKEAHTKCVPVVEVVATFFRQTRENYQQNIFNTSETTNPSTKNIFPHHLASWSKSKTFGLIPLAIVVVLIFILAIANISASRAPPILFPIFNTIFIFATYLIATYFAAGSFLKTRSWQILLFGVAILMLGVSATLAAWLSSTGGLNIVTQVHNISALIASFLILLAASFSSKDHIPRIERGPFQIMTLSFVIALAIIGLITLLAFNNLLPTFVTASGPVLLRQIVYGTAAAIMGISTLWLLWQYFNTKSDFVYWFSLGLALITTGFISGLLIAVLSDALSWLSRLTLYFSGIYFMIAGLVARSEARSRQIPIQEIISEFGKKSKVNYEMLVNAASDAIIAVDGVGRILMWNPAAEEMFGYSKREIISSSFFNLLSGLDEAASFQKQSGAFSGNGTAVTIELKGQRKGGQKFPVELTLAAQNVAGGWLHATTTLIVRDITERKQAEESIKENERAKLELLEKLNQAQHVGMIGSWDWDLITNTVWWSDETYRIFGVTPDFVPNFESNGKFIHPDDFDIYNKVFEHSLQTGEPLDFDVRLITKEGLLKYCNTKATLIKDEAGKPLRFIGTFMDITERKQAEEQIIQNQKTFSELVERAPFGIYIVDSQFQVSHMNVGSQNKAFMNVRPIIGRDLSEVMRILWPEPVAAEIISHFRHTLDTGEPYYSPQFINSRADVQTVESYEWELHRMMLPNGKYGVICYYYDSTKLRESEESLQKYNKELEAANKDLEAFGYSVTHDMKQPLRALGSFSDLLYEEYKDKLDETGKDYLERIRKASLFISELTEDMLKLSRITRAEMKREPVDLGSIANSIINEFKDDQPLRQIEIKIAPNLIVSGDTQLLTMALRNLLENAWKFTLKCQITHIELGSIEEEGKMVYFIKDNGIGFDMRYKDKLFQPFQRLTTDKDYPGTGIGLAIVQRIIRRHGGKIWAEAETGKGATFYFTLG